MTGPTDQMGFFDVDEWTGMPEFAQADRRPHRRLIVNFDSDEDYAAFGRLVEQRLTPYTDNIWYPEMPRNQLVGDGRPSENDAGEVVS